MQYAMVHVIIISIIYILSGFQLCQLCPTAIFVYHFRDFRWHLFSTLTEVSPVNERHWMMLQTGQYAPAKILRYDAGRS